MARQRRGNGEGSVFKRGRYWWIAYYDEHGVRQTRTSGLTEKRLAERVLQTETDRVTAINRGLVDLTSERLAEAAKRGVAELAEVYGATIRAAGRTEKYAARTQREVREFAEAAGIETLGQITAEHAVAYLESLRTAGQSVRTRQCRITSVKGFTRWAWREGLLAADPLAGIRRPNPATDRRHERRALRVEEWRRLEAATIAAGERFGMSGQERAMLYAVALQTGLRAGELRTLTRGSLHLDEDAPFIVVKAGGTKNRKVARQFIQPGLAATLRRHSSRMAPGAAVFSLPTQWRMAPMLREDLADARATWINEVKADASEAERRRTSDFLAERDSEGRVIDFHALRYTCGDWAARGGASPKAVQTLMRHSTITLTLDTYGSQFPDEAADTVAKMVGFDNPATEAATGTGDECSNRVRNARTERGEAAQADATRRDEREGGAVLASIGAGSTCGESVRLDATPGENGPARIRTEDRAIMSRQL